MVYFSNREMKILRLMTYKNEGVSIDELVRTLGVSKRTIYREISRLEETVERMNLTLEKSEKLYQLTGESEDYEALLNELSEPLAIEWADVEKRQIALLITIALKKEQAVTQGSLAETFDVSLTTIQEDLNQLSEILSKYKIRINRSENSTLYLSGSEVYIRLYFSQILSNEINAFDFFQKLKHKETHAIETESQYLLSLVNYTHLRRVYESFEENQPEILSKISDNHLMNFVFMMSISLMRLEENQTIQQMDSIDHDQLFPYMQKILSIVKTFEPKYKQLLDITELSFFAMQFRGMNVRKTHSIFQKKYDMELGFNIKYLIQLVSSVFQFNFNPDNTLYHDLINHIGAALKRLDLNLPEIENSVLSQLKEQYTELYGIVEEKLIEVFSPTIFSEQEIGYIVTHFASSFEKHGERRDLRILVVCTSGIGTSKILKARLERSIQEINDIDVVRAIDLKEVSVNQYDHVFSTITLPRFDYNYTLINPLLDKQEIEAIKRQLNNYQKAKKVKRPPIKRKKKQVSFQKIKHMVNLAETMIQEFKVIPIDRKFDSMASYLETVFKENYQLKRRMLNRLNQSPLAIPESGILLLHTTDKTFGQPMLKLHHLKHPIPTLGMDRQPTMVHRIIVMFGPENMDELTMEFLGTISSSIIENEENTKIYREGTTEELRKLFEEISVEILQQLLE